LFLFLSGPAMFACVRANVLLNLRAMGLFSHKKKESSGSTGLELGLTKTRHGLLERISRAIFGKVSVDAEVMDKIEEALIASDVGIDTTSKIIERLQKRVEKEKVVGTDKVMQVLKEEIEDMLNTSPSVGDAAQIIDFNKKPYVIMVVGVNGVGKTTTIGKIAAQLKNQGKKVVLGAADTFRAAAVEQLDIWAHRSGADIVKQQMGSDPAAVAYDTVNSAVAQHADVVLIDTAGRLQNKVNLMNELTKIKNVMRKVVPDAPQEVLLVLDGSTGQNAFIQAREFSKATQITALAITKLDGTAKGGVVIGIANELQIPVKFVGVGEKIEDLQIFDKTAFVESIFR